MKMIRLMVFPIFVIVNKSNEKTKLSYPVCGTRDEISFVLSKGSNL